MADDSEARVTINQGTPSDNAKNLAKKIKKMKLLVPLDNHAEQYIQDNTTEESSNKHETFLALVEKSDYEKVIDLLSVADNVNVNDVGIRDGMELTALEIASYNNDFYMVNLLQQHKAKELGDKPPKGDDIPPEREIHFYSAVSSPAYISLSYLGDSSKKNYLQVAFEREHELSNIIHSESSSAWKEKYENLRIKLKDFTVDLLNCCRDNEVEILLRGKDIRDYDDENWQETFTFDREPVELIIAEKAIETGQKEFIAHYKCQHFLKKEWLRGQRPWTMKEGVAWALLHAVFAFFVYGILHQIIPIHLFRCERLETLHKFYDSPKSAFLCHYFHYALFLLFVFLYEIHVDIAVEGSTVVLVSEINYEPILYLSIIWFVTLCAIELGQFLFNGPRRYFGNYWNILDLLILLSFLFSVILANPVIVGQLYSNPHVYVMFSKLTTITLICALLRFIEPLYLFYFFGPILIVFTEMRHDILRFMFIFAYVVVAYALALYYFYADVGTEHSGFSEFSSSLRILLITIFGGDGSEHLETREMVPLNASGNHSTFPIITSPYYTAMGYVLYILFGIIVLIMLLNLCIAMMTYRYERIQAVMDLEWRYRRSEIWVDYIGAKGSNLNAVSLTVYIVIALITLIIGPAVLCYEWLTEELYCNCSDNSTTVDKDIELQSPVDDENQDSCNEPRDTMEEQTTVSSVTATYEQAIDELLDENWERQEVSEQTSNGQHRLTFVQSFDGDENQDFCNEHSDTKEEQTTDSGPKATDEQSINEPGDENLERPEASTQAQQERCRLSFDELLKVLLRRYTDKHVKQIDLKNVGASEKNGAETGQNP